MRVMLATPTLFRVPTAEYLTSVMKTMNLLAQHSIALDTCFVGGDAFIAKARNGLVESFIKTWSTEYPADMLMFVDDDQSWDEQAVLRAALDPHEVIAAAVPKKMDSPAGEPQVFNNVMLDTDEKGQCYVENGLLRTSQIGSGMLMLKRSAVEKVIKAYSRRYSPGDGGIHNEHYNLFEAKIMWGDTDEMYDELVAAVHEGDMEAAKAITARIEEGKPKLGQFWGEDLIFCKKWIALGERIWLDPNVTVEHIGRKSWSGNFMHHLQRYAKVEVTKPVLAAVPSQPQPIPETLEAIEKLAA